jgi:hypothetical protein
MSTPNQRGPLGKVIPALTRNDDDDSRFDATAHLESQKSIDDGIASGRIKALNVMTMPGRSATPARAGQVTFTLKVREDLATEIKIKAAQNKMTSRTLVMLALKEYGLTVLDEDLVDARRERIR